ncbi:MAG: cytochrome c oxidase subunit II [Deltaproteobacteria bacterium]|nr:cytochrome c oxidase subunit II [Deltaproteobacteria bacterium]
MANVAQPRSQSSVPEGVAGALPASNRSAVRRLWPALTLLAWIAVAALCGCSNEPAPRDTHNAISESGDISSFFYQMLLWLDVAIGAIVIAAWGYALVRFKRATGDDTLPAQNHGDAKLELIWTAIPTVIVIAITVPMLVGVFRLAKRPDQNQQTIEIDVTGKQWWWEFQYKSGTANGLHTANEVHVQAGTAVVMNMTSSDVIHAWWVPRLTGKRDATPGRSYPLYFSAREPGIYDGQCAELCGASHALMGTKLFVHPPAKEVEVEYNGAKVKLDSYETWVKEQLAPAAAPAGADMERGAKLFKDKTCPTCHIVKGLEGAESASPSMTTGPNLTHVGSRMTIAANTLPNTADNLAKWILDPQAVKPGAKMTKIAMTPDEAKAIAAFLTSLK